MMRGGSDQEWFGDEGWFAVHDDLPILVQSIFLAVEKTKYLEMGKLKEQNFMLKCVIFQKKSQRSLCLHSPFRETHGLVRVKVSRWMSDRYLHIYVLYHTKYTLFPGVRSICQWGVRILRGSD